MKYRYKILISVGIIILIYCIEFILGSSTKYENAGFILGEINNIVFIYLMIIAIRAIYFKLKKRSS